MKIILIIMLMLPAIQGYSQITKPQTINLAYYGETITHPGFRVGAVYPLFKWEKTGKKEKGLKKKQLELTPSIGFFYHRNYQTAVFFIPELAYSRKKKNGNYIAFGFGTGYMRTFLPRVYGLDAAGDIQHKQLGYNYFVSGVSVTFGRELSLKNSLPLGIFMKPQIMYAVPNYAGGILYLGLECGLTVKLN